MAALPYIQLYVADYLADTAHLTTVEHGAYLLLIMNYWQKGESFKAKDERTLNKRLATVARMNEQEWENVKETLSEFFEIEQKDGICEWIHSRIERDLLAVNSKSSKAKAAGQASAQKRANSKHIDNTSNLNERSTNVQRTFNHTEAETNINTEAEADKESVGSAHTPAKKSPSPGHKKAKSQITFDYSTIETPDFIDRGLWLEWLNARKDQHPKASQSEIAIKAHLKTLCEIESEGMSANAALVIAIKGGADGCWIGIETEWIRNRLQKSETRVTGYQATEKPAIRDFVQERTQNAIDEGKRRMMERKANESAIVLPATEFVTLQQRAVWI